MDEQNEFNKDIVAIKKKKPNRNPKVDWTEEFNRDT